MNLVKIQSFKNLIRTALFFFITVAFLHANKVFAGQSIRIQGAQAKSIFLKMKEKDFQNNVIDDVSHMETFYLHLMFCSDNLCQVSDSTKVKNSFYLVRSESLKVINTVKTRNIKAYLTCRLLNEGNRLFSATDNDYECLIN